MENNDRRLAALKRFATAITILNIAGHFFLGFEQSIAHLLVALFTAYTLELSFEKLNASLNHRKPVYAGGGIKKVIYFLLPAHISALAVSMLMFTNQDLLPVVFATALAILSKIIFRVNINGKARHFLNPSNTGIAVSLILFPWVGIAPPYQFTENVTGVWDWVLPLIFITAGSLLNAVFTKKMPLIFAWLIGFFLQGVIRSLIFNTPLVAPLIPMTGVAFLLFTFYMISDPSTTPVKNKNQIIFGLGVAGVYGLLQVMHVVFGLFFSLLIVCSLRGMYFWVLDLYFRFNSKKVKPVYKEIRETVAT